MQKPSTTMIQLPFRLFDVSHKNCCPFFLSLFFCFLPFIGSAQIEITGTVKDSLSTTPLGSASVVFYQAGKTKILGYGITDSEGTFKVLLQTRADSLTLKVSTLGYTDYQKTIASKKQNLKIPLTEKSESLKEIFIRKPPIQQRGDTLIFDPDAFKSNKDRSIQDVLAKMPGVEIKPSGEIYYQGKPINKFYVEGLDLMGGQYGMVSNNLSPDEVESVEILENHQPLKVLDSIVPSERAAINLKLKNKVTLSGNLKAGGGAAPGLWYGKLTPMFFTKKFQALVSYQTNNTGEDVNQDFSRFSTTSFRYGSRTDDKKDWLSVASPSPPPFSSKRWLDNESHAVSANALVKGKKDFEYKVNASYINNFTKRKGGQNTTYLLPEGDTLIKRTTLRRARDESMDVSLSVERNEKSNFLKNTLNFSKKWDRASTVLSQNQQPNRQDLNAPFTAVNNNFEIIFPFWEKLFTFNSNIGYNESPQDLAISPGVFTDILSPGEPLNMVKQQLTHKRFFANHSVSFTEKLGNVSLSLRPGIDYSNKTFDSQLLLDGQINTDQNFQNAMRWQELSTYANVGASYKSDEFRFSLKLPFDVTHYQIEDRINGTKRKQNPFTFNPSFWTEYKFLDYWKARANARYSKNFGPLDNIYSGYLLTYFRSLRRRDVPLAESDSQNTSVSLKYRNPITSWFGRIGYSYSGSQKNQINNFETQPDGSTVLQTRELDNKYNSNSVYANVSRLIPSIKTTFKLSTNYSHTNRDFLFNGALLENTTESWNSSLKLTGDFTDWLTLEYTGSLGLSQTENAIQSKREINSQNHSLGIYVYLFDNHTLNFSGEWLKNKLGNRSKENFFGDFMYRFTLSQKRKIDIEFSVINIFNKEFYRDVSVSSYALSESFFVLRPRQFLLKVRFPL